MTTLNEHELRQKADKDLYFNAEALKLISVKTDDPEAYEKFKQKYGYENNLTGYDLLHGYCHKVAYDLFEELGRIYDGVNTRMERAYVNKHDPRVTTNYSHEYCVVTLRDGTELYADIRGICDDYNVFMQDFVDYERDKFGINNIEWVRDSSFKHDKSEFVDMEDVDQLADVIYYKYGLRHILIDKIDEYSNTYYHPIPPLLEYFEDENKSNENELGE